MTVFTGNNEEWIDSDEIYVNSKKETTSSYDVGSNKLTLSINQQPSKMLYMIDNINSYSVNSQPANQMRTDKPTTKGSGDV